MRCAVGKSFRGGAVAEDGKKLASRKELIFTFFCSVGRAFHTS